MGINIGPLLAGAGVIGLAIGFGAQTLVKDIIAGIFFLIDDAFRVGDYIETGGLKGSVEHISLNWEDLMKEIQYSGQRMEVIPGLMLEVMRVAD